MKNLLLAVSATALLICAPANADEMSTGETTIIVMDGSGSMWGQIDGRTKLEIARDTVSTVLRKTSRDTTLGLMAYGHREKGNCEDIELVVPPAKDKTADINRAVQAMNFLGKTPLSEAVRRAAQAAKHEENKTTIVLVTDGIETCNADPCALGKELEAAGLDFTAHVIGFGLSKTDSEDLVCLAESTGGQYIEAGDGEALEAAMKKTVITTPSQDTPVDDTPAVFGEATVKGPKTVSLRQSFEVEWTGPDGKDDFIDIQVSGNDSTSGQPGWQYTQKGNPATLTAPGETGGYVIRYVQNIKGSEKILATQPIEITDAEFSVTAPDAVTAGTEVKISWSGPSSRGNYEDYIDLMPEGIDRTHGEAAYVYVGQETEGVIEMPVEPGTYTIRYVIEAPDGRVVKYQQPITVESATAMITVADTVAAGEYFDVSWDGPATPRDYVDLVPEGYTERSGELSYYYVSGDKTGSASLTAPDASGQYDVRYILDGGDSERRKVIAKKTITVQ